MNASPDPGRFFPVMTMDWRCLAARALDACAPRASRAVPARGATIAIAGRVGALAHQRSGAERGRPLRLASRTAAGLIFLPPVVRRQNQPLRSGSDGGSEGQALCAETGTNNRHRDGGEIAGLPSGGELGQGLALDLR